MSYEVKMKNTPLYAGTLTECLLWLADSFGNVSIKFLLEKGYKIDPA